MIWQIAIATVLPGFKVLARSVTCIFLLMDHFFYKFQRLEKNEANLSVRTLNFLQNAPSNSAVLRSLFITVRRFQMPLGLHWRSIWSYYRNGYT